MELSPEILIALPVLLFSLVLHEFAHAYTAYLAGDMTAASQGRLTLNPIAHIDPVGTLIIPVIQMTTGVPLIGWAKPVPINPLKFKSSEWDIFVSLAGPGSNLLLVIVAAILLKIGLMAGFVDLAALLGLTGKVDPIGTVLVLFIMINVMLTIFNLIPIPPLDGSRVLYKLLAQARSPLADKYAALEQYGFIILMLFIVMPPTRRALSWLMMLITGFVFRMVA